MKFFSFVIFILSISHAIAQVNSITGHVQNIEVGHPIEFVHVFIANSTIGTTTDEKGNFILENLGIGDFDLVASFVGYELFVKRIQIVPGQATEILIKMTPQLVKLDIIEVSDKKDLKWQRQLKRFTKEFLGSGSNARQCKILNPWVIDFQKEKKSGLNIANSDSYIEVLNNALGYKIFYYLKHFKWNSGFISYFGYPRFEVLETNSKQKEEEWELQRKSAYEGSIRHMFYAIVNNRIEKEGFQIYQHNKNLGGRSLNYTVNGTLEELLGKQLLDFNPTTVVRQSIGSDPILVNYYGTLEVIYINKRWEHSPYSDAPYQVSTINFFLPVRCTNYGYVFDQMNYKVSGYFMLPRIAKMLPFEYGSER